ncbi:MAG TPA: flippase [archaeon]|nr:flippase [archaeon]
MNLNNLVRRFLPKKAIAKLSGRPMVQKVAKNIGWLTFDRFFQLFISFTVILWMIRYLGPEQWGTLNYVWAFTGIFSMFIPLGLNLILTRELVVNKNNANLILGTAFFLQIFSSLFFTLLTIFFSFLLIKDSKLIFFIIISSISNLFFSFQIISTYFDSIIEGKIGVISRNFALGVSALIKVYFIFFNYSLIYFVILGVIEQILLVICLSYFYLKTKNSFFEWRFDFNLAKELLFKSWPLILSTASLMIYLRIDQLFIGTMLSMYDLGLYSVIVKLAELGNFIPSILIVSTIPIIIANKSKIEVYTHRLTKLYSIVLGFSIILFLFLFIFADFIILLLYGVEYSGSSNILRIYSFAIIPFFLSMVLAQYFIIENLTKYSLYTAIIAAVSNIILNLLLIPIFGVYGAAIATVISYSLLIISLLFFKQTRPHVKIILNSFNFFKYLKI